MARPSVVWQSWMVGKVGYTYHEKSLGSLLRHRANGFWGQGLTRVPQKRQKAVDGLPMQPGRRGPGVSESRHPLPVLPRTFPLLSHTLSLSLSLSVFPSPSLSLVPRSRIEGRV